VVMDLFSRKIVGWSAGPPARTRTRCGLDRGAPKAAAQHDDSFGSGHPIWQRCLTTLLPVTSPGAEHESQSELRDNAVAEHIKKQIYTKTAILP
jgi:hypothetical protein